MEGKINITVNVCSNELGTFESELNAPTIGEKYLVNLPHPLFADFISFDDSMTSAVHTVFGEEKFNKLGFSINSTFQPLGNGYFAIRQGSYSVLVHPLNKFSIEVVTRENREPFTFKDGENYVDFFQSRYQTTTDSLIFVITQGIMNQRTIEVVDWRALLATELEPIPYPEKAEQYA